MTMYLLWLSKTKRSNDLKAETTTMAQAKDESQYMVAMTKATAKDQMAF